MKSWQHLNGGETGSGLKVPAASITVELNGFSFSMKNHEALTVIRRLRNYL